MPSNQPTRQNYTGNRPSGSVMWRRKNHHSRDPRLGLTTKAKAYKGACQEWTLGVTFHAHGDVGECKGMSPHTPKWCRNPTLAKCEDETHTPKVGNLESFETPECLEFENKAQNTSHWGVLGVIGKSWSVDVQNGLALVIWTSATQVMSKRRAGSQTGNLSPDH
jgi:hypothetical protein